MDVRDLDCSRIDLRGVTGFHRVDQQIQKDVRRMNSVDEHDGFVGDVNQLIRINNLNPASTVVGRWNHHPNGMFNHRFQADGF